MTDEELATLETLAAAATAGPWETTLGDAYYVDAHDLTVCTVDDIGAQAAADAVFIAASRTAVPALIAEVRRLRGALGYSEHRVTMLRAELVAALDEGRHALDAVHTRCDAPEAVLHARLAERGETWGARESAERAEVLRLARIRSWPVIDTTRDRDVVLAEALACVRGVL